MRGRLAYRRLRTPQGDGEVLIDPPLRFGQRAIAQNRERARQGDISLGGRSMDELSRAARELLWRSAIEHTCAYATVDWGLAESPPRRIYLVGHQPQLFHPGVWLKNFVLDGIAQRDGAAAIHVLIDNDVVADATIPVITGAPESPRVEHIALDQPGAAMPWEERPILEQAAFASAPRRIADAVAPFVERPLVIPLWNDAERSRSPAANLGEALAQMRHRMECRWGLQTLEVPLSAICNSDPFRWFVALVLSRLPQLQECHNDALAEYRRAHRLRSLSHPLPDLARHDGQFETPFWIWQTSDPRRRRLFAEAAGNALILRADEMPSLELPTSSPDDFAPLVEELRQLEASGVKIRPRALMTTMYLRVFLSDYFIHGIGGAKYDQITDCLIEELFGIAPPDHMIVSGTKLLPVNRPKTTPSGLKDLRRRLRDIEFHPERFLDASSAEDANQVNALIAQKRALTQPNSNLSARQRHQSLTRVNAELQKHVSTQRAALLGQLSQGELDLRRGEVLNWREFPFCIFPESALRPWLLDAVADAS